MASVAAETAGEDEWPTEEKDYQYDLKDVVGEGAFAKVYRAFCVPRKTYVAVKIMDLDKVGNGLADIRNEVATMKKCEHPNVLTCHSCFTVKDKLWMVMPLMDRGSCLHIIRLLKDRGIRDGLPEAWTRYILSESLKGVKYLHDQNLLHRDLKAGNILLDSQGNVKIADFGVSGWMQDSTMTKKKTKTFVGTPCWMAPEVMEQSEGYSFPADVWSMGITAFELAKGTAPYAQHPPMKVLLMTLTNPPPTLKSYPDESAGTPSAGTEWVSKNKQFLTFVSKCLMKTPKDRAKISQILSMKFFKNAGAGKSALVEEMQEALPSVFGPLPKYKKLPSEIFTQCAIVKKRSFAPGVNFVFSDDEVEDDEKMFDEFFNQGGKEKAAAEDSGKEEKPAATELGESKEAAAKEVSSKSGNDEAEGDQKLSE